MRYCLVLFFCTIFLSLKSQNVFELSGTVRAISGEYLYGIDVSLWQDGEMMNSVESDIYGEYTMPLFKTGTYQIIVAARFPYFHQVDVEEFTIHTVTTFTKSFELKPDQHRLKHTCTRLVESDNQVITNPKNEDYKQLYFKNFPTSSVMIELFFNRMNRKVNLNRSEDYFFKQFFEQDLTGSSSYIRHILGFAKTAYPNKRNPYTEMYRSYALAFCKDNSGDMFNELSSMSNKSVETFFKFLFFNETGVESIPKEFSVFQGKFQREYNILMRLL